MIISHFHKFIFFAVPKTGTQSIRRAIRPILQKNDWEQCTLFERKSFPIQNIAKLEMGHINYNQIAKEFRFNLLDQYTKFCFLRDPIDRFLSYYYFVKRDQGLPENPLENMKKVFKQKMESTSVDILFRPQADFITDENGEVKMDLIGNYQEFGKEFVRICKLLNLPELTISHINRSRRPFESFIDCEMRELIHKYYHQDYEIIKEYSLKNQLVY